MDFKMKPRKGTANKGQEYEMLLPALFALKFLEDSNIENFLLRSNIENFECWDDLLISLKYHKTDVQENYAFQLKHKEKKLKLQATCLEAESKNFGILKYCEGFSKICERDNYYFIIYTNAYIDPEDVAKVSTFAIKSDGNCPGKKYFFLPSSKNEKTATIYNFQVTENTKRTDTATDAVYKSFFKKFAFYAHQKNWQEVQELVIETFKKIFRTSADSIPMAYIDIFKLWKLHEYSAVEITKEDLKIKILDLILSPYILTPMTTEQNSEYQNFTFLEKTFTKFDVILISDKDGATINKIVSKPHFEEDEDIVHLAKNMKLLTKFMNKRDISEKQEMEIKQKIGYFCKQKPIVLEINGTNADTVATTIVKFKKDGDKLHFVLLTGETSLLRTKLSGFKILETLYDLHAEDNYQEVMNNLRFFFNEKECCYYELFGSNDEIAKNITITDMSKMLTGNFHLDVSKEKLQNPYIPRSVSITLIKIESIDEIHNDIIVISHRGNSKIIDSLKTVVKKEFVELGKYLKETIDSVDLVIYQNIQVTEDLFKKVCQKNSSRNVHHFTVYDEECLQWISTKGSIVEVKKCEVLREKFLNESEIYEQFQNRINVIVASPGMGKSEILKKLKNTCPSGFFPILINLKEFDAFLKDEHEDEKILDYFLRNSDDDNNLLLFEIKRNFVRNKTIIFYLDGLDELKHENISTGLKQIKQLSNMGFKVWLTSRSHLKETIENFFDIFTIDIKSFTEKEQRCYIKGRLKNNENVESLTTEIFKNIDTMLENREILDLPLQLFMITEILIEFPNDIMSNIFVLTRMFHYFFSGRYRYFFNKCKCDHWESLSAVINDSKNYRLKQYQIAALKSCLSQEEFESLKLELDEAFVKQIQIDGDFLGIVVKVTSSIVIFHHDITATYFAALWLAENFATLREFLKIILFKDEYIYLRLMFDMILAENFPTHVATLYRNIKALNEHKKEIHTVDRGGRSNLHLACSHCCRYTMVKNIHYEIVNVDHIKYMRKINEESRKILNFLLEEGLDLFKADVVFGWNCFDFCEKTLSLLPLEIILEQKEGKASRAISEMDIVKHHNWTILYYSAAFSYAKLFQHTFANTNLKTEQTEYLLVVATMWNSWKIINILLDNDVDIHTKTKYGRTILHLASSKGHKELVILLLLKGADVNSVDQFGRTPFHLAAANGHISVVKKLLEEGAKLDAFDKYGRTPLHLAAEKGNEELTKFLIDEKCADVNKAAWNGWACLQLAIMEGHANMVRLLLERNADYEKMDGYGTKPLHIAAKRPNVEILEILLTKSSNIDVITSDGRTSLHLAAESGNITGIEYLLKKGANINALDRSGRSVLHWAVIAKQFEAVDFLLENHVDFNTVDHHGRNCLQWAAEGGNLPMVKLLLGKMTKLVNERAKNGSTALHWAAINGHNDIVNLLLYAGANINIEDVQDRTPLCWAALEGHTKTVELLLAKNAVHVFISGKLALEFAKTKKNHI